jgi:hypothetical protein
MDVILWSLTLREEHRLRVFENRVLRRNTYRILVGKPEGKRPRGRPRHGHMDNIKMDHRAIVWDGMDWIDAAQDRDQWRGLVKTTVNIWVP